MMRNKLMSFEEARKALPPLSLIVYFSLPENSFSKALYTKPNKQN